MKPLEAGRPRGAASVNLLAFDRAIAAAYLGLVEIKRGETKTAISWLDKAREFDPRFCR